MQKLSVLSLESFCKIITNQVFTLKNGPILYCLIAFVYSLNSLSWNFSVLEWSHDSILFHPLNES